MNLKSIRNTGASLIVFLALAMNASAQQVSPPADQPTPPAGVSHWPQRLDSPDGLITVFQPQPTTFEGDLLTARAAVSLTPTAGGDEQFGAMWFTARVFTDRDARTVTIQNLTIKQVKLPNASADQEKQFGQVIEQRVPSMNLSLSLDQLESTLGVVQKEKQEAQQLDNTPPKIIFTTTPATLVLLDGPPKLQEIQTQGVMAVVNTPFILLLDMASKRYFLKAGDVWMVAPDVTGPWAAAGTDVPPGVLDAGSKLAAQTAPPQAAPQPAGPTQILVAEEPTELIASNGPPQYAPIVGNELLYMSSTDADVFLEVSTQDYFVLLSGRWFQSKSLQQGPWTFVAADKLPPSFAQIPANSPKANVLASVAGTQDAKDAKLDAFIPQTTAIRRDSAADLNVSYDGAPQFVPVENTPITYASNCADPVLCVENAYYCCHQAVWYRCPTPIGTWVVCESVPQIIYTIPPSCPVYNCRYVYVYDSTPEVVYCGYLPGYTGCYVYGPTIVYGTGYRYPFWYHAHFIPHPYTWGFGARYDYYAGTWGYGASAHYGSNWFAARPERHDWFGPQGYVDYRDMRARHDHVEQTHVANPVVRNETINRVNLYNRQENVKRNVVTRNENPAHQTPNNEPAKRVLPPADNNVFVGQDGKVYRHTDKGWETRDAKGWTAYQPARGDNRATPEPKHNEPQPTLKNEPVKNEPVKNEPVKNEPVRNEPVKTEPVKTEPVKTEPVRNEPVKNEPVKTEPVRNEPVKNEPVKNEPVRNEPVKNEPVKTPDEPRHEVNPHEATPQPAPAPQHEPVRAEPPARIQPAPGGLDDDYNARQRGAAHPPAGNAGEQHSTPPQPQPPQRPTGGGGGGGGGGGAAPARR